MSFGPIISIAAAAVLLITSVSTEALAFRGRAGGFHAGGVHAGGLHRGGAYRVGGYGGGYVGRSAGIGLGPAALARRCGYYPNRLC